MNIRHSWSAIALSPLLALGVASHAAGAQSSDIRSTAAGFSFGVFGAGRTFQSTVDGDERDMINGGSGGIVVHGGFNEHHGIALRLQGGRLDLDREPQFGQADITYRYTFRRRAIISGRSSMSVSQDTRRRVSSSAAPSNSRPGS